MTLIQDQDTPRRRRPLWPAGFRIHPPIITTLIISTIVATAWRTGVFHHDLGLTTEYLPYYAMSGITARRDWARANEDVVLRFLRAHMPVAT